MPAGRRRRNPRLQERLLRHLLRRPGEPAADRRLRRAAVRAHVELHPGLPVHLDRRPGAARATRSCDWLGPILSPAEADPNNVFTRLVGDGRPIWVTDLTNPSKPEVSDQPVDLWRNDGYTDYSHDVDEDEQGIAWVSGRGGIRGYATTGYHRDPYQNRVPQGHAVRPDPRRRRRRRRARREPVMLMHNSGRPTDGAVRADGVKKGNVLVGTEEEFQDCSGERPDHHLGPHGLLGRRAGAAVDAERAVPDEGARHVPPGPRRAARSDPGDVSCSAHYFEIEGSTLGAGWYGLGLRLLDISDARTSARSATTASTGTGDRARPRTRGTWRSGRTAARAT